MSLLFSGNTNLESSILPADIIDVEKGLGVTKCDSKEPFSNNRIPQKAVILQMEDLKNLRNSVSNALIKAMPKCDVVTIKIFELIISAINPKNPPKNHIVYIEKNVLYDFLGLNSSTKSRDLERKLINFRNQLFFNFSILNSDERNEVNKAIEKENNNIQDDDFKLLPIHKNHIVSSVNEVFWEPRKDYVGFQLTPRIMFFLSNLGEGKPYTTYELIGISKFESKYSVILYRWLKMKYQNFKYANKEYSVKHKIEIDISDLRNITDTVDVYPRFSSFEERILKTAQKEINEYSVIKFDYKKIKKGRTIKSIQFFIEDNKKNIPVKEEKLAPRKTKEEREADINASAYKAIINPYTKMLANNMLLVKGYETNAHLLARLNDDLYPIYDEIIEDKGEKMLKLHISRLRDSTVETRMNDQVAYLITCAKRSIENNYKDEIRYKKKVKI